MKENINSNHEALHLPSVWRTAEYGATHSDVESKQLDRPTLTKVRQEVTDAFDRHSTFTSSSPEAVAARNAVFDEVDHMPQPVVQREPSELRIAGGFMKRNVMKVVRGVLGVPGLIADEIYVAGDTVRDFANRKFQVSKRLQRARVRVSRFGAPSERREMKRHIASQPIINEAAPEQPKDTFIEKIGSMAIRSYVGTVTAFEKLLSTARKPINPEDIADLKRRRVRKQLAVWALTLTGVGGLVAAKYLNLEHVYTASIGSGYGGTAGLPQNHGPSMPPRAATPPSTIDGTRLMPKTISETYALQSGESLASNAKSQLPSNATAADIDLLTDRSREINGNLTETQAAQLPVGFEVKKPLGLIAKLKRKYSV